MTSAYLVGGPGDGTARVMPESSVEAGFIRSFATFADVYTPQGQEPKQPEPGSWGKYVRTEKTLEIWEWEGDD